MSSSVKPSQQGGKIVKVFESTGDDFSACYLAEEWCRKNVISVGIMQGPSPRGLLRGDFEISKWRNLTKQERDELHGQMTGDMRHGPVKVEMFQ